MGRPVCFGYKWRHTAGRFTCYSRFAVSYAYTLTIVPACVTSLYGTCLTGACTLFLEKPQQKIVCHHTRFERQRWLGVYTDHIDGFWWTQFCKSAQEKSEEGCQWQANGWNDEAFTVYQGHHNLHDVTAAVCWLDSSWPTQDDQGYLHLQHLPYRSHVFGPVALKLLPRIVPSAAVKGLQGHRPATQPGWLLDTDQASNQAGRWRLGDYIRSRAH